jgi:hypothetical protein
VVDMTTVKDVADELAEAHSQVLDALVRNDAEVLDRLVADDCRIVGPKGFLIGKQEWIEAHSGLYEQVLLEVEHTELSVRDECAVRVDLQRSECLFKGETIKGLFRVLNVWSRAGGTWRLVGIQYTAVAPEAAGTAT